MQIIRNKKRQLLYTSGTLSYLDVERFGKKPLHSNKQ